MAFQRNVTWNTGDPITQERMNNIQRGIEEALDAAQTANQSSAISALQTDVDTLETIVGDSESAGLRRRVTNLEGSLDSATQLGSWAAGQIHAATDQRMSDVQFENLDTRFVSIENEFREEHAGSLANDVNLLQQEVAATHVRNNIDSTNTNFTSLVSRLNNTDQSYQRLNSAYTSFITEDYGTAKGSYQTLAERLTADEDKINVAYSNVIGARKTNGTLDDRFDDIESELNAAHESTALNKTGANAYGSIDARFEAIESELVGATDMSTRLDTLASDVSTLTTNKVNKTDVENNLLTEDEVEKHVLDARQGRILNETIQAMDTAYKSADTNLSNQINNINTTIGATDANGLRKRISDLETDVNNSTTGLSATKAIADEALVKANAAAVAATVDQALTDLDERLDALDGGSVIDTTDGTLSARLNVAENAIGDLESFKADTSYVNEQLALKANSQDVNSALAEKASTTSVSELNTIVQGLLNKDTIVVPYDGSHSNYTNNLPNIPTANIKSESDYLIADNNGKYFYWRYINNNWELISGAGNGGSGTSSGVIVDELPSAAEADENTDYFVYDENADAYLHYRFTTIDNVKQAILIGADLSNLKQYNIEKIIDGDKTYLRLYEFNYGDGNAINLDNTVVFPWVSETSYDVDSLVLYQGYFYKCLIANNDTNWTADKWERISDIRAVTTIELPQGGGGSSTGAVTRFIRLAPTSITTIQNNDPIYIHFFYSCVDPNEGSFEGHYTLTDKNGVQLLSDDINSGSGTDAVTTWPQDKDEGQIYNDGYGSIDVSPYCVLGKNTFNLVITTDTNETFTRSWTVDIKQLNIESTASETAIVEIGNTIDLPYIPYGAMQKTLIVKIDGVQVKTESLGAGITGTEQICTIPAQSVAGAHTIELKLSASINGDTKYSDPIVRDYIWYNPEDNNTIIISSPYRNEQIKTVQYSEIVIPYTIYKANTNNFTVEYYYEYDPEAENTPFDTVSLINSNHGILRYIPTVASLENTPNHLTIKVEDTTLTFDFIATPMQIDIAPVGGEVIDFNPATLNNNSANRLPSYLSVSDNFNWSSNWEGENQDSGGGYRTDEDGKCFVIKAGTYADIDYKMFKQYNVNAGDGTTRTTSSVFNNGAEMKIIFKVTDVRDASAIWFTNTGKFTAQDDTEVGIQLSAHEGWLKTDKASNLSDDEVELPEEYRDKVWSKTKAYAIDDIVVYKSIIYKCIKAIAAPAEGEENSWNKKAWQSLGQLETEISATNSYLYFPYSEDDKIELDININQQGNNQNFIMSYEDGVPSKAYPYNYSSGGDILYHVLNNESIIRIGSPDCDVHIYRLRIYNKSLSTNEILKNFIADGATVEERVARYDRNSIYYSPELNDGEGGYTPYKTGAATLDPYRLAERIPNVKVLMLDTPRFTTGKKDFVKGSTLRCIQAAGGKIYPANLDKDNWYFFNGYHAGQGTTSDNYGQSARNVDFLFECDTEGHAPTKKGNLATTDFPDPNYVSAVAIGSNASVYDEREKTWAVAPGVTPDRCINWMDDSCKISLTHIRDGQAVLEDTSIPNNYFNLKVNVASSENVNNALFQKRYNDFLPYTSPAKNRDARIKNDMEFVPAVLFIRERDSDISTHKEFKDTDWHFYALGNLGDSKKTDYTRAYDPTDVNEFTIEISDNNTANSQFQSGVFYSDPLDETTATVETQAMADNPNIDQDPMKYIYPITSEQWNAKDGSGQYINYRHKTLSTDPFDGDHSFEFRYACCGAFRDGDIINPYDEESPEYAEIVSQGETNRAVWEAFYEWIVTSTEQQFRDEAALWFVPSAVEFFYAFTHYYTMMDNRAKNTFWHFAKTGTRRAIPIGRAVPALFHIYEESDGNGGYQPASGTFNNTKQYYTQYAFDLWVYDTDTACGIDNNGELSFPYGKEDRDYRVAGQAASGWAFNGSGSIFWRRLSDPNSKGGFADEISALMRQEDDNCFATAQHLINQFDEFQNCFPEEIWRLDIERKYIRTFTGASVDNSIQDNKQNIRFLRAMMQGRKKYQRRQWVRNQAVYFGSKYGLSNVRTAEHTIEFNIYTPSSDGVTELAVPVDQSQLVIKPYQDMYIDVAVGNSTTNLSTQDFKRAKAGERIVVDCRSGGSAQETRVYIFGGEHIAALENLAPMYTYSGSFGQGKHLKVLDLGSDNPNYNNPRFTSISINENMPLLERFSVKNCNRLAQSIDLHLSNNLREFEADGSLITGVSLPDYSSIEILHLPATVTSIALNAARALDDFYIKNKSTGLEDYSNLITLNINDSDYSENIDWLDIASQTLNAKINWLYLQNLSTASIQDISALVPFENKKKALEVSYGDDGELIKHIILSGNLNITGEWSAVERDYFGGLPSSVWPGLHFNTDAGTEVTRYKIVYKYDDNTKNGEEIYSMYITPQAGALTITIPEIYSNTPGQSSIIDLPDKSSTRQEYYVFGTIENEQYTRYSGWKFRNGSQLTQQTAQIELRNIENNTIVLETVFRGYPRSYPVRWYLNEGEAPVYESLDSLGNVVNVEYGKTFNGHIPTVQDINANSISGNKTNTMVINGQYVGYKIFNGWQSAPINLTLNDNEEEYKIYANWITAGLNTNGTVNNTVTIQSILDQEGLSIEKMLLLSKVSSLRNSTYIDTNDRFKTTLGYDGLPGGTLLTLANGFPYNYNGNRYPDETSIVPFNSTNDAFTLVLDYQFDTNYSSYASNTRAAALAGCYKEVNGSYYGFVLYFDTKTGYIKLGFGDFLNTASCSKMISNPGASQYRNIIVLRHPKNSSSLYIYSGINYTSELNVYNDINDDGIEMVLNWNNITNSEKLVLGSLATGTLPSYVEEARGKIYWAKYWNEDLGAGECRQLAAWPHEQMEFAVEDYDGMAQRVLHNMPGYTLPNITFAPMNLSTYVGPIYKSISQQYPTLVNGQYIGWNNSWYQKYCNSKLFYGLPIALQSIIVKTPIYTHQSQRVGNGFESDGTSQTHEYIFSPAYAEIVSIASNSSVYIDEAQKAYDWNKDSNILVYSYNNNERFNTTATSENNRYRYMNLRFPYKAINTYEISSNIYGARIFKNYSGSTAVYTVIQNSGFTPTPGDIFIKSPENVAYMYVSATDVQMGAPIMQNTNTEVFACNSGGWIRAEYWFTRSAFDDNYGQSSYTPFIYITPSALSSTSASRLSGRMDNYNNSSIEELQDTPVGGNIIGAFGI